MGSLRAFAKIVLIGILIFLGSPPPSATEAGGLRGNAIHCLNALESMIKRIRIKLNQEELFGSAPIRMTFIQFSQSQKRLNESEMLLAQESPRQFIAATKDAFVRLTELPHLEAQGFDYAWKVEIIDPLKFLSSQIMTASLNVRMLRFGTSTLVDHESFIDAVLPESDKKERISIVWSPYEAFKTAPRPKILVHVPDKNRAELRVTLVPKIVASLIGFFFSTPLALIGQSSLPRSQAVVMAATVVFIVSSSYLSKLIFSAWFNHLRDKEDTQIDALDRTNPEILESLQDSPLQRIRRAQTERP